MIQKFLLASATAAAMLCAGAAEAAPGLEAYGALPSVTQVAISPDGSKLAIAGGEGAHRTVEVRNAADNSVLFRGDTGDAVTRALLWTGPRHVLVVTTVDAPGLATVDRPKSTEVLVGDLDLDRARLAPLHYNGQLRVIRAMPVVMSVKGHPKVFVRTYNRMSGYQPEASLHEIDFDTRESYRLVVGDADTEQFALSSEGRPVARADYNLPTGNWTLLLRKGETWKSVHTETDLLDQPALLGVSLDGTSLLVRVHDAQGWAVHQVSLADGAWSGPLEATRGEVPVRGAVSPRGGGLTELGVVYDPATHAVAGVAGEDLDHTVYALFSPEDQKTWDLVTRAFPGEEVRFVSWSDDRRHLVVHVEGTKNGSAYFLVDAVKGTAAWITDAYAGLDAEAISARTPIHYAAADGLDIPAYLTLPKDRPGKALPLVVLVHGGAGAGPGARDEPGFDWLAQGLASRGYAVLQPQFRGSRGFGEAHFTAGFGQWAGKMQSDLSDGVRALAAKGVIDPARVCIMGADYGGYAALAGVIFDTPLYRCAVDVDGPTDLRRLREVFADQGGRYYDMESQRAYDRALGVQSRSDEAQDAVSPALHAERATAPILVIHAANDGLVMPDQAHEMVDALKRAGKPAELVVLKDEDRALSHSPTRQQMLNAAAAFLEKNNPPNPAPAKP